MDSVERVIGRSGPEMRDGPDFFFAAPQALVAMLWATGLAAAACRSATAAK